MEDVDPCLPAISTIFYSTFSGFAWIYLAKLKLEGIKGTTLATLGTINDKSYNGAMYLAQPYLWYVPLSISFTILMIQLFLLKRLDINKRGFISLFSLLTVTSYLTHITEAVIFSIFLCFYSLFSRRNDLRFDEAILASLLGFTLIDIFYLRYMVHYIFEFSMLLNFLLTLLLLLIYVYRKLFIQNRFMSFFGKFTSSKPTKLIFNVVVFAYLLGFITWIGDTLMFRTSMVLDVGLIPWFIYPVLIGVLGILTLKSLNYLFDDTLARKWLEPFITLMIFSIIFGKTLTFINVNLFNTGYWEKRFSSYLFLTSAVLAPLSILKVVKTKTLQKNWFRKVTVTTVLVGLVTVYGLQSTFMVLQYWSIVAPLNMPRSKELEALNFLKNLFMEDKYAYTIALTWESEARLMFAAPPYNPHVFRNKLFYTATYPEMGLETLHLLGLGGRLSHAYLYMHNRDKNSLSGYGQSWLARHLSPMLPTAYENDEVSIYNISSISPPRSNASTLLIIPFDTSIDPHEKWLYTYDILSQGRYDYTTDFDLNHRILSYPTLILSIDPPLNNIQQISSSGFIGWSPVAGNWRYTVLGLQAGRVGEYQDAILISPISTQTFKASLTFRPLNGNLKVANYVSIIYDWKDKNNFKYAGLMFDGSGVVYAYFSSYKDGVVVCYPGWPGLNTGLRWGFGGQLQPDVSADGEMARLYVNGRPYLRAEGGAAGGKLGIRMTRFYDVLFTSFEA
ncbi:hypothetical protein KEJ48_07765, partial [Candidatus Bathyarchaeota archaeon]|nr:hypothetical protein [Candidatus Bathyarchaeota archaeon]